MMVRRLVIVAVLLLGLLAITGFDRSDDVQKEYSCSVTTDSAGDSTYASGTIRFERHDAARTVIGQIILAPARSSYAGLGNQDSCWMALYTNFGGGFRKLIDSITSHTLPGTLLVRIPEAVGDTGLYPYLEVDWAVYDSLGDTAFDVVYPLTADLIFR